MKERLDSLVIDAEFLLISVIQGVALAALAANSTPVITDLKFEYWPYIISAFLIILIFWSQAITHVLGFIRWPLDLNHNFLYFLASLIEVMAFNEMLNPLFWFSIFFLFVVVSGFLYYYDLLMIKQRPVGKELFDDLYKEQLFDLKTFVPAGLIFNFFAAFLIYKYPVFFIENKYHLVLIGLQILFGIIILFRSFKTFNRRIKLIQKEI